MSTFNVAVRASRENARLGKINQHTGGAWKRSVSRIAQTDCAVLLTGETGAGKGFIARTIHDQSSRAEAPFVPVNCGAIPDALIDSHLFGHAKGSFSGADKDHAGLVRAAEGGTLLLDEIADLPMTAQCRLLRVLEEKEVQPVGYSRPVKVNVRIIAATSADLHERVRHGSFRKDLHFRLDVVRLHLPPLRARPDEIDVLIERFNNEFATLYRQPPLMFDPSATRLLHRHDWPGNVRELRTIIERLHVLCGRDAMYVEDAERGDHDLRVITAEDLTTCGGLTAIAPTTVPDSTITVGHAAIRFAELKVETVNTALNACGGNMSHAATTLGVHRSTLYRWLQAHHRLSA